MCIFYDGNNMNSIILYLSKVLLIFVGGFLNLINVNLQGIASYILTILYMSPFIFGLIYSLPDSKFYILDHSFIYV